MSINTIEQQIFESEYQLMLDHLELRSQSPTFLIEEIEAELKHLCIYQGQDYDGRGALKSREIQAHIYAYEVFIKRYKDSLTP